VESRMWKAGMVLGGMAVRELSSVHASSGLLLHVDMMWNACSSEVLLSLALLYGSR
jgi:hypothetical protein